MALARSLNRTLVLPPLWCYCDKFWRSVLGLGLGLALTLLLTLTLTLTLTLPLTSRLADCAIPEASSSQPLPFACPMDHVVELEQPNP